MLLSSAALLALSVLGAKDGLGNLSAEGTWLQRSVTFGGLIYAVFGSAAGIGVLLRRLWSVRLAALWGLAVTYTGTVATFAWAEPGQPILVSAMAAFVACLVICGLVVWGVHVATRQ